jgi:large subunit ribosomal protein L6
MSKIGKAPITIPSSVTVTISPFAIAVKGPHGELTIPRLHGVEPKLEGQTISFSLVGTSKQARSNWGTFRALVANAVRGITTPFQKTLVLEGVGFRVTKDGNDLVLALGFSHPVRYSAVPGITFEVEKNSILTVKGSDRAMVGQVAAEIRALKKPEPYKGKGFRYSNEVIIRKAGKKAAASTTK